MDSQYTTGKYWEENSSLHEEDSDFKFDHFLTLLKRNRAVNPTGVIDMGCGAGRIIWNFSKEYPNIKCKGIDLSEKVISYAKQRYSNSNLSFEVQSSSYRPEESFNLVLLADVFEHVADYIGFLAEIKSTYKYQLFNIPMDLSVRYLLNDHPLETRASVGHLHYFYDKLILKILDENGFKVIDYSYANNLEMETLKVNGFVKYRYKMKKAFVKMLISFFGESLTSKLYGGFSLSVLCERK